ncbi:TVG0729795 [Thermoplasma volcanium GSS1]|uniref:TVG0729795 protein n=1 Tax=Thermoplasma volcanium (strain ATCC 51530 / DSM 4299 / JCM 9571 / NBRC 15438 / GSS1) TaxID=273116 RepID=Q97AT8_THEVO|nr:TVG0729795 [Thermoplasma volcanium GSS1]
MISSVIDPILYNFCSKLPGNPIRSFQNVKYILTFIEIVYINYCNFENILSNFNLHPYLDIFSSYTFLLILIIIVRSLIKDQFNDDVRTLSERISISTAVSPYG